ncbi:AAA family ATPase [Patulibacter minatonensis]|uniref:AAA family ATPase n=1 Tax=Patulibacter minatonensis TaxID=298163 RepID=UPI0004B6056C|nr:MoxR family ATPase [Patulibacter minatonensis]
MTGTTSGGTDTRNGALPDRAARRAAIAAGVVGRGRELDLVLAAVSAGRDVLLEGPPGTGKSTLLRAITKNWGVPFVLVEGNAELTASRLVGHHDPARVLREGYTAENFVPGPLVAAMEQGGFLYIEEFNRAPEDTINVLLAAMAEREVVVPRFRTVAAAPTFRVVASMNPFDAVGTARISESVYDRWCRLVVGFQDAAEEEAIVAARTGCTDAGLVQDAVAITRASRSHRELRRGASVRGAIDLTAVAVELAAMDDGRELRDRVLDAAMLALSARIFLDEASERTPEDVIRDLWEAHYFPPPGRDRARS